MDDDHAQLEREMLTVMEEADEDVDMEDVQSDLYRGCGKKGGVRIFRLHARLAIPGGIPSVHT